MKSSQKDTLETLIGKEFWGILSFEMNLPALYHLIDGKEMGIGLNRLSDWLLFPHKIPTDYCRNIAKILENRFDHPLYCELLEYKMTETESRLHYLVMELLQLKYAVSVISFNRLKYIYEIPEHMFVALLSQFIESKYLSAIEMTKMYTYYRERNREGSA